MVIYILFQGLRKLFGLLFASIPDSFAPHIEMICEIAVDSVESSGFLSAIMVDFLLHLPNMMALSDDKCRHHIYWLCSRALATQSNFSSQELEVILQSLHGGINDTSSYGRRCAYNVLLAFDAYLQKNRDGIMPRNSLLRLQRNFFLTLLNFVESYCLHFGPSEMCLESQDEKRLYDAFKYCGGVVARASDSDLLNAMERLLNAIDVSLTVAYTFHQDNWRSVRDCQGKRRLAATATGQ